MWPSFRIASRHDRRAESSPFLTARYTGSDEKNSLVLESFGAPVCVLKLRVSAVDDNVSLLQMGHQLIDHLIHCFASLHHQHNFARAFEKWDQLLKRMSAHDARTLRLILEEFVYFGD